MRITITAEANSTGVMVAIVPPKDISQKLIDLSDGNEPLDEQHLTLAYLGDTDEIDQETLLDAVEQWAMDCQWDSLTGKPNGWGVFSNEQDTLIALWDIPWIAEFRASLNAALIAANCPPKDNHGFTPHQSMRYSDDRISTLPPKPDFEEVVFDRVVVAYGGEWVAFPLDGDEPAPGRVAALKCTCCGGSGKHRCGHGCYECDSSGSALESNGRVCAGHHGRPDFDLGHVWGGEEITGLQHAAAMNVKPFCPCGTPVVYDPQDGWQHEDGSVSHNDGTSVSDKMRATSQEIERERNELLRAFAVQAPLRDGQYQDAITEGDVAVEKSGLLGILSGQSQKTRDSANRTVNSWLKGHDNSGWQVEWNAQMIGGAQAVVDYSDRVIRVAGNSCDEIWLIHECCHIIAGRSAGHGAQFLAAVEKWYPILAGPAAYRVWRAAFDVYDASHGEGRAAQGAREGVRRAHGSPAGSTTKWRPIRPLQDARGVAGRARQVTVTRQAHEDLEHLDPHIANIVDDILNDLATGRLPASAFRPKQRELAGTFAIDVYDNGERTPYRVGVYITTYDDSWVFYWCGDHNYEEAEKRLGSLDTVTLYHGTRTDRVASIKANGLTPPPGTAAMWFMLTSSEEQAAWYVKGQPDGVVLEYQIPKSEIFGTPEYNNSDSEAYLWPGHEHMSDLHGDAMAYAIKNPVPSKYLTGISKAALASRTAADDYRMNHRPAEDGPTLDNLIDPDSFMPSDTYDHPEYYGIRKNDGWGRETLAVINSVRGKPNALVTIYRAAPSGVKTINSGDWVSLAEGYARQHAIGMQTDEAVPIWPVISAQVPAHTVRNAGNDLIEWGYWGGGVQARLAKNSSRWLVQVDYGVRTQNQVRSPEGPMVPASVIPDSHTRYVTVEAEDSTDAELLAAQMVNGTGTNPIANMGDGMVTRTTIIDWEEPWMKRQAVVYDNKLIARGFCLNTYPESFAKKVADNTVTAQDFAKTIQAGGGVGVWWGIMGDYGDLADFEDHAQTSFDPDITLKGMIRDGYVGDRYIEGEISVVVVAKRPMHGDHLWDPNIDNRIDALMGNSYLPDGQQLELVEIRYDAGWGWKSLNCQGIRAKADLLRQRNLSYHLLPADDDERTAKYLRDRATERTAFVDQDAIASPFGREALHEIATHEGFTVHDHFGDGPKLGYMVSTEKDAEEKVPLKEISPLEIALYKQAHAVELRDPDKFLGAWVYKGNVYLDISTHVDDKTRALQLAKEHHQLGVFDLKTGTTIDTSKLAALGANYTRIFSGTGEKHYEYNKPYVAIAFKSSKVFNTDGIAGYAQTQVPVPWQGDLRHAINQSIALAQKEYADDPWVKWMATDPNAGYALITGSGETSRVVAVTKGDNFDWKPNHDKFGYRQPWPEFWTKFKQDPKAAWVMFCTEIADAQPPGFDPHPLAQGQPEDKVIIYRGIILKNDEDPATSTNADRGATNPGMGHSWTLDPIAAQAIAERGGAGFGNDNDQVGKTFDVRVKPSRYTGTKPAMIRAEVDLNAPGVSLLTDGRMRYASEQEVDIADGTEIRITGYRTAHTVPISEAEKRAAEQSDDILATYKGKYVWDSWKNVNQRRKATLTTEDPADIAHDNAAIYLTGNPPQGSDLVRQFAITPAATDFFAGEADDLSRAYRDLPLLDPSVVPFWVELGEICTAQANALRQTFKIIVHDDLDPYDTAEQMHADMDKGIYQVTSLHSHHQVWTPKTNVDFRIAHDLMGHGVANSDFSLKGEVEAYQAQCKATPEKLWPALFTEIIAQAAYANTHHLFGEQKVGLIPLTQAQIDSQVGKVMDAPDPDYDRLHYSASRLR